MTSKRVIISLTALGLGGIFSLLLAPDIRSRKFSETLGSETLKTVSKEQFIPSLHPGNIYISVSDKAEIFNRSFSISQNAISLLNTSSSGVNTTFLVEALTSETTHSNVSKATRKTSKFAPSRPAEVQCENGLDKRSRKQLWHFRDNINPAVYDAFAKNDTLCIIFNVRKDVCKTCRSLARWSSATWICLLCNGAKVTATLVADPDTHTLILQCQHHALSSEAAGLDRAQNVSVTALTADGAVHRYSDIPVCRYPHPQGWGRARRRAPGDSASGGPPVELAACTMLRSELVRFGTSNAELVLEWIAYHRLQVSACPRPRPRAPAAPAPRRNADSEGRPQISLYG